MDWKRMLFWRAKPLASGAVKKGMEWPTREEIRKAFPTHPDFGKVIKMAPVQYTICDDCGRSDLENNDAIWTEDGASYCPSCRPKLSAARKSKEACK